MQYRNGGNAIQCSSCYRVPVKSKLKQNTVDNSFVTLKVLQTTVSGIEVKFPELFINSDLKTGKFELSIA